MADDDKYFLYDRSWMYNKQFDDGAYNIKFLRGVEAFLSFAISKSQSVEIRCPCVKCKNFNFKKPNEVRDHLLRKGFVEDYYDWRYHYDILAGEGCSTVFVCEDSLVRNREENPYAHMVHDAAASTFPKTYHNFFPLHDSPQNDLSSEEQSPVDLFEEPNPQAIELQPQLQLLSQPQPQPQSQPQPQPQSQEDTNNVGDNRTDERPQPQPHTVTQSRASWDDPSDPRPLLPWLPIKKAFDPSKEISPKQGVSANIGKTFKLSLDPHGTTWSKISDDVKEFYWNEFKKFYKWDPRIEADVKHAWNSRCAQRYRDKMTKLRSKYKKFKEQQKKERQEREEHKEEQEEQGEHHAMEFTPNMPSNVWSAWKNTFESDDFKTLSDQAKVNRRRGEPDARPLPTYRGGGLSAARLRELMAKESGDVDLTPHRMLVRTKGVRGDGGERLLVTDIDKQINKMYNDLNDEDLRKGKTPDINKNYLKAVDLVAKKKKTSSRVYGLGSADEVFYPERFVFHTPQSDLRRELDELHSTTNEFRTYINVQMSKNNPSANELLDMRNQLTSMQETIRRLESQLTGESSRAGEASGSRVHGGSLGGSHGSLNTRASGGSGGSRMRHGGGNSSGIR